MDPSSSTSGVSNGSDAGEKPPVNRRRQRLDPPEEIFELANRSSSYQSSFRKKNIDENLKETTASNGIDDDDHLDEFEMEGLIATATNVVAAADIKGRLRQFTLLVAAACSLAWNPRNRNRSAIGLLFLLFLCMMALTDNDALGVFSIRSNGKSGRDPLADLTPDQRLSLLKKIYGTWTFYDGSAEDRPKTPYMTVENAGNPNLDLAEDKFPLESWQADAVYANHFLDAAIKLVRRGQQAIFSTYHGYGLSDVHVGEDGETVIYGEEDEDHRISQRLTMFQLAEVDLNATTSAEELQASAPSWQNKGGWTTKRSFDGLGRRLRHAITTESDFVVVITGSWQTMGYGGNHAWQSMPGVFETLLKGLFEKIGVKLVVRAIGLPPLPDLSIEEMAEVSDGGKSTFIHTLGWSSIYGSDVDMVVWDDYGAIDDGNEESAHKLDDLSTQMFDLFARQALLSGTTSLPFIWGGDFEVLRNLHEYADVDVGQLGNGLVGVQETTSEKTVNELPWAARYVNCPEKMQDTCQEEAHQFESKCWIDRSDFTPPTPQLDHIPIEHTAIGWRMQQLKGYTLAYNFLQATLDAMYEWSEVTILQGFPLADEYWHMGEYIKNVQEKVKALDEAVAPHCFMLEETMNLPKRLCQHRMKGRTEFTPRALPAETSIRTLIDPTQVPKTASNLLYSPGGDVVLNPLSKVPTGEVDALEIFDLQGEKRLRQRLLRARNVTSIGSAETHGVYNGVNVPYRRKTIAISPGEGWQSRYSYGDGCDGSLSSSSSCGGFSSSNCLMEGHQGSRGGIWGNETTGWLFFHGISVENGFVALNLEIGGRDHATRRLALPESLPDSFVFEYTAEVVKGFDADISKVDRTITTLDKDKLLEKMQQSVPGTGVVVVYDDIAGGEAKDISIGVRVTGCADQIECQFAVTHVYWS